MARKTNDRPDSKITHVRFVLPNLNSDSGVKNGVFKIAYKLWREGGLSKNQHDKLGEILRWFGDNLERPGRFNRTKSKGYYRRATKGISWFKPTAKEHIANMHAMVSILKDCGHHIEMIKTRNPGYVVYEDDHQIVAEPFSDLRD